mmetsp:Transcript_6913/g.17647  ORF Transcript_6913/g.17647 Transcript_6913/m.17647 type:complete len:222 (-) Transcript_6913:674-1339(-)
MSMPGAAYVMFPSTSDAHSASPAPHPSSAGWSGLVRRRRISLGRSNGSPGMFVAVIMASKSSLDDEAVRFLAPSPATCAQMPQRPPMPPRSPSTSTNVTRAPARLKPSATLKLLMSMSAYNTGTVAFFCSLSRQKRRKVHFAESSASPGSDRETSASTSMEVVQGISMEACPVKKTPRELPKPATPPKPARADPSPPPVAQDPSMLPSIFPRKLQAFSPPP